MTDFAKRLAGEDADAQLAGLAEIEALGRSGIQNADLVMTVMERAPRIVAAKARDVLKSMGEGVIPSLMAALPQGGSDIAVILADFGSASVPALTSALQ